ncbi:hypothetical protein LPJ59_004676 [Coemansia sp. RSA 2399]|nr:hypothetical protein LPJ59_004676 [Coemansia sp. RSA 2399]
MFGDDTCAEVEAAIVEASGRYSLQSDSSLVVAGSSSAALQVEIPERRSNSVSALSADSQGLPTTTIIGSTIQLGLSSTEEFFTNDAIFVDKSAAIIDVMSPESGKVVAGVYPRRTGKSTFLQLLFCFLDIDGGMERVQRETMFQQLALSERHPEFFVSNFAKYPVLILDLKGNSYLKKGILVGVFDIRGLDLGSGLNNIEYYLAHTGYAGPQMAPNPFQHAFGFTVQDVWALIGNYAEAQRSHRTGTTPSDISRFKRHLLADSIKHFDGYRIGQVHRIFIPYTILSFLRQVQAFESLADIDYSTYSFWVDTGSMSVVETIRSDDLQNLRRYCDYLLASFLRQSEHRRYVGPRAELMSSDDIADGAVEAIGLQEQSQFPSDIGDDTCEELAKTCMFLSGDSFRDMLNMGRAPLQARTVMRLLYQAGYMAPVGKMCVGIPNPEVYRALEQFYTRIAAQHNINTHLLESTYVTMGIHDGELGQFAQSFHKCLIATPGFVEGTLELAYRNFLSAYLHPITRSGYYVQPEATTGNGSADITVFPALDYLRSDDRQPLYYIFELKRYKGSTTTKNEERMSVANRRKVAKYVFEQALGSQTQIYDRYLPTIVEKAGTCKYIYVVGMSFWVNRFCMIVTKRENVKLADGSISWPVVDYEGGINIDGTVTYEQIGDNLGNAEVGIVRQKVVNGNIVVLTI